MYNFGLNDKKEKELKNICEAFFIFAIIWAIGLGVGGGQDDEKNFKDFKKHIEIYCKSLI